MNAPPAITRFLAVCTISLWGVIGYRVYVAARGEGGDAASPENEHSYAPHEPYVYKSDVRDPFRSISIADSANRKKKVVENAWTPPPLKVTGIVGDRGKETAIVETASGDVSFVREGETVSGVKIVRIQSGHVTYEYMKQKKEWVLGGD